MFEFLKRIREEIEKKRSVEWPGWDPDPDFWHKLRIEVESSRQEFAADPLEYSRAVITKEEVLEEHGIAEEDFPVLVETEIYADPDDYVEAVYEQVAEKAAKKMAPGNILLPAPVNVKTALQQLPLPRPLLGILAQAPGLPEAAYTHITEKVQSEGRMTLPDWADPITHLLEGLGYRRGVVAGGWATPIAALMR